MMSLAASYDVKNLGLYYTLPKSFGSLGNKCDFYFILTFLHDAHYPKGFFENQKQHSKEDLMSFLCIVCDPRTDAQIGSSNCSFGLFAMCLPDEI